MDNKWIVMHHSTARSLEELPDTALDALKEAIKKEEDRRDSERARELQERIVKLMRQIEDERFWVMNGDDKLNPSNIEVQ